MISGGSTIDEARLVVAAGATKGVDCPCCGQLVKMYKRGLSKSMVKWLMWLNSKMESDTSWVDVGRTSVRGGDYAKLAYWGLIEQEPAKGENRPGKPIKRSGLWRVTGTGKAFLKAKIRVPRYKLVYNGKVHGDVGADIGIEDILSRAKWAGYAVINDAVDPVRWEGPYDTISEATFNIRQSEEFVAKIQFYTDGDLIGETGLPFSWTRVVLKNDATAKLRKRRG